MLYDNHPTYPHHAHLPFSHEPLKAIYVFQRVFTTLLLVPVWTTYYAIAPRSRRPCPSWSLRQIIFVNFTRRIYKVTEVAGATWGTRNPDEEPAEEKLKETRFEWVPPLPENLRTGIVNCQAGTEFKRVGNFVWPRVPKKNEVSLIGIYMHGGGFCHMSAHEKSRTSRIPRRLIQVPTFSEIYAIEYRLLQYAPFPAVVQDAAAVYAHVVQKYRDLRASNGCKYQIVLIGDSSGGNLALALTRWVRDEGVLPMPDGLLLLSPSCDISHVFPLTPSSYIPRPHASTDYLVDTPESRALLQRTFLGFGPCHEHAKRPIWSRILRLASPAQHSHEVDHDLLMAIVHSEYVSPASPQVLRRHGHEVPVEANKGQLLPDPMRSKSQKGLFKAFPRTLVTLGTHERLVREVKSLVNAMRSDGVDVQLELQKDGVHDIFIVAEGWWDEKVREQSWKKVNEWIEEIPLVFGA